MFDVFCLFTMRCLYVFCRFLSVFHFVFYVACRILYVVNMFSVSLSVHRGYVFCMCYVGFLCDLCKWYVCFLIAFCGWSVCGRFVCCQLPSVPYLFNFCIVLVFWVCYLGGLCVFYLFSVCSMRCSLCVLCDVCWLSVNCLCVVCLCSAGFLLSCSWRPLDLLYMFCACVLVLLC